MTRDHQMAHSSGRFIGTMLTEGLISPEMARENIKAGSALFNEPTHARAFNRGLESTLATVGGLSALFAGDIEESKK